jgi:DNA-binding transcriptional MerR regulator
MITSKQAAEILGIDIQMVWYYARKGKLKSRKIGKSYVFTKHQIEKLRQAIG